MSKAAGPALGKRPSRGGAIRRALLVFAEDAHIDLARRALPRAARPLFALPRPDSESSHGIDIHLFRSSHASTIQGGPQLHQQTGRDFGARLENAIEKLHELAYTEIVVIGGDCPGLRWVDIEHAFATLGSRKLVIGPDHRGGCYLIAFHLRDRDLIRGIRWKQHTDCAQLRHRCLPSEICVLPRKHELDSWADVRLFARSGDPLARLASFLLTVICGRDITVTDFVDLARQQIRVRWQMPPPAFAV
jgi:hypothetical protein